MFGLIFIVCRIILCFMVIVFILQKVLFTNLKTMKYKPHKCIKFINILKYQIKKCNYFEFCLRDF